MVVALNSCSGKSNDFELLGSWQNVNDNSTMEFTTESIILINGQPRWNYQQTSQNNLLLITALDSQQEVVSTISYDINQNNLLWQTNKPISGIYEKVVEDNVLEPGSVDLEKFIGLEPKKMFNQDHQEIIIAPGTIFAISLPASASENISWQAQADENISDIGNGIQKRASANDLHHFGFQADQVGEFLIEFVQTDGERIFDEIIYTVRVDDSFQTQSIKGKLRSTRSNNITLISGDQTNDFIVTSESILDLINIGENANISYYEDLESGKKYIIRMSR